MQGREPLPRPAATLGMEFVDAGTIELGVSFLRPVRPGRLVGRGQVVHRDGELVYLEASLADPEGVVVATATAIARVIGLRDASAAA
jgi:acyl-coenzyme A thioesterase PaaI-like protein